MLGLFGEFVSMVMVATLSVSPSAPRVAVPENLKPAANEHFLMAVAAKGVQIYECRANEKTAMYEWIFVAPQADLRDASGNVVGKHYSGPRWESSDGSIVVGTVKERAPSPAAGAIPWLLLTTKAERGTGLFSGISSIQRVNTTGGAAPISGCGESTTGTTTRVPYTADYYLFTRN
jgi:hypothetical protein